MEDLKGQRKDMEGRMRGRNVQLVGVPEQPDSSSPVALSELLRETLQMDGEEKVDHSH